MIDQLLLNDTLQKINVSLNKRFEKDANLYISKQDEYEIKKNLCDEAYGGIVDIAKAKGISHDIIMKVIMRNAGVLNVSDIGRFKKELKPILEDANYGVLSYMMEDVLSNNVYMQKNIRHIIFDYYMNGITDESRINYWKCNSFDFDIYERKTLFELIIEKTKLNDLSKTLSFKINFIQEAFEECPSLMKENVFNHLKNTLGLDGQLEFFNYLCVEMKNPSIDDDAYRFILVDAYASYGERAFNDVVSQIKATSPRSFKQYIKVICKLFRHEKDKDILVRMFDTIYKIYESPHIKNHVKREIEKKVWRTAKLNPVLYEERKEHIDGLMSSLEETDKKTYSSFSDIYDELDTNVNFKNIAYFWINMRSPDFEQSILESFTKISGEYLVFMKETYSWLFNHSMAKGKIEELNRICERMAEPLHEFYSLSKQSDFYNALDELWLNNVVTYKLQGTKIKKYMFEKHFDLVKEWK